MVRPAFEKSVSVLLENAELFVPASEALERLNEAQKVVEDADISLRHQIESLNSRLALEIRRNSPALVVTLSEDGNCVVRYKGFSTIRLNADPQSKRFKCGESPFERRFRRYYGHTLELAPEVLGEAVAKFYKQNYRSIR